MDLLLGVLVGLIVGGPVAWRALAQPAAQPAGHVLVIRPPAAIEGGRTCAVDVGAREECAAPDLSTAPPAAAPSGGRGQHAAPACDPSRGRARRVPTASLQAGSS